MKPMHRNREHRKTILRVSVLRYSAGEVWVR